MNLHALSVALHAFQDHLSSEVYERWEETTPIPDWMIYGTCVLIGIVGLVAYWRHRQGRS